MCKVHKSSASAPVCCVHFVLHYVHNGAPAWCVEYTSYYIMCTMVHIVLHHVHNGAPGQCGRDNAIAGGDTVSTLRKTHNDDEGEFAWKLYGNH